MAKKSARQRRQKQMATQAQAARRRNVWIGGITAVLVLLLVGAAVLRQGSAPAADDLTQLQPANTLGAADAPVSIVEFGDFGCPSCRLWHNSGVKAQLQAAYGDQISFTFRHFPVITRQSPKAAEASQCAAEQDAFWPYHDYLYEQAPAGALSEAELAGYAVALGLDGDALADCLDDGRYQSYVSNDLRAARAAGARGTPAFFVNGRAVPLPTFEQLSAAIDQALGG